MKCRDKKKLQAKYNEIKLFTIKFMNLLFELYCINILNDSKKNRRFFSIISDQGTKKISEQNKTLSTKWFLQEAFKSAEYIMTYNARITYKSPKTNKSHVVFFKYKRYLLKMKMNFLEKSFFTKFLFKIKKINGNNLANRRDLVSEEILDNSNRQR